MEATGSSGRGAIPHAGCPRWARSDLPSALDRFHYLGERLSDRDTILLRAVAIAERHRTGRPVVLAGDEHERHLGLLGGANLLWEPVVRRVDLNANLIGTQTISADEQVVVHTLRQRTPK